MEKWLHPDFLFVVDYEMETRREWLKETEWLFELEDYFSIPNFKLLYEDKNVWSTKASILWMLLKKLR